MSEFEDAVRALLRAHAADVQQAREQWVHESAELHGRATAAEDAARVAAGRAADAEARARQALELLAKEEQRANALEMQNHVLKRQTDDMIGSVQVWREKYLKLQEDHHQLARRFRLLRDEHRARKWADGSTPRRADAAEGRGELQQKRVRFSDAPPPIRTASPSPAQPVVASQEDADAADQTQPSPVIEKPRRWERTRAAKPAALVLDDEHAQPPAATSPATPPALPADDDRTQSIIAQSPRDPEVPLPQPEFPPFPSMLVATSPTAEPEYMDALRNQPAPPGQFKYNEVVRSKEERERLLGVECAECRAFYATAKVPQQTRMQHVQRCSRHRFQYVPPREPPNFWHLGVQPEPPSLAPSSSPPPHRAHVVVDDE